MTDKFPRVTFICALATTLIALFIGAAVVSPCTAYADSSNQYMYRLYNFWSGEHFYTASTSERDNLIKAGWMDEGIGWVAPTKSNTPVYRLYSGTDHHYTTDISEKNHLVKVGWKYEGIGWYSDDNKTVALYRQYNPNVNPKAYYNNSGSHNYTTSEDENDSLVRAGWRAEGIGWYGSGVGSSSAAHVNMNQASVNLDESYFIFTGKEIKPKVVVTYLGQRLAEGADYRVSYYNNKKAGYGEVAVTGIGRCYNTVVKSFYISDASLYDYQMYVLGSADLPIYSGRPTVIYFKTNHPANNISYSISGPGRTIGYAMNDYPSDLNVSEKDMIGDMYKVDGGFILRKGFNSAGTYTVNLTEKIGNQEHIFKSFTVAVKDYAAAEDAFIEEVLAKCTNSSMDSFQKMSAVASYLKYTLKFKYLDTKDGSYITLAKRNVPYFVRYQWDSYTSPSVLCKFAEKIGGFDSITNMYGEYARGTTDWQKWHYYCKVTKGSTTKYYEACPDSTTSVITSYDMIDPTDTASFVHYDSSVLRRIP